MNNVPVILITYNRPRHTHEVLKSLQKHAVTNLYIFSDAPKKAEDENSVRQVRELIRTIDWCKPVVTERQENFGLAKSIVTAVNAVFEQYDRLILLEDDCVPGKHFFDFISKCLDKYANHEDIFGISGHTVPISQEVLEDYPYDLYFSPRIGSWGWATWKRAWQFYDRDIKRLVETAKAKNIDWNKGGNDWPMMFSRFLRGEIKDVWTMNWVLSVYNNNGSYIFPTKAHINNIGTDGSGEHCGTTSAYDSELCDTEPKRFPEKCFYDRHIISEFWKRFDSKPRQSNSLPVCGNSPNRLKVAQINTLDFAGGAAKVAWTLKESLKERGHNSQMFVGRKDSDAADVCLITDQDTQRAAEIGRKTGLLYYEMKSTFKLASNPDFVGCDIFHFHNLHGDYFNLFALPELTKIKPCVWTLHDMQSLTGHCAHSFECEKWKTGCGNCQHLDIDPMVLSDQTAQVWKDKQQIYSKSDITVVVPSNWLKAKVEQGLLKDKRVELIYNGIDTRIFKPGDKAKARQKLGLPLDGAILAFAAHGGMDSRWRDGKGLAQAVSYLSHKYKDVFFLNIGHNSNSFAVPNTINVPYVTDQRMLACIYAAADMFLFPSLADNCPLSVIEAMACGLPVISYRIGGIPELVCDGQTGILAEYKNVPQFAAAAELLIVDKQRRQQMSTASVSKVKENFTLDRMVEKYLDIYQELKKPVRSNTRGLPAPQVVEKTKQEYPKISIVTPSFNQAKYLEQCMRSVLEQGYPNLEYFVIDGGSTDGSADIIRKYESQLTYWVSEPDQGQYHAITKGFAKSSGEIMGWLNSDDTLHTQSLWTVADVLGNNKEVEWLMGQPTIKDGQGRTVIVNQPQTWSRAKFLSGDYKWIQQESTFWKRALWERAGAFLNTNYSLAADLELWVRFFRHAQLFTINALIGSFRYHGDQKSQYVMDKYLLETEEIILNEIQRFIFEEKEKFNPPPKPVICYDWAARRFVLPSSRPPTVDSLIKTGQEASKAGKLLDALQTFLQIVPMRSEVVDIYAIVGALYKAIGRKDAAAIAFEKALQLEPTNAVAKKNISEIGSTKKPVQRVSVHSVAPANQQTVIADKFDHFTFSRKSQIDVFCGSENFGPDSNLKAYQDLLVLNFIINNVPAGAKLLEIGGGESRIIDALQHKYECWNIDKLEGLGNGPLTVQSKGYKLVKDYMGNFNRELPDNYFDLVFSISALEHVPEDETIFKNICLDIDRVLKPNGYSLHCFDVIVKQNSVWSNKFLPFIFEFFNTSNKFVPFSSLNDDMDLWAMSETAYNLGWKPVTKKDYVEHGKPISYNVLWQKLANGLHLKNGGAPQQSLQSPQNERRQDVLVSAIVSTYNSERFFRGCLEDLENQTIADKLEIIVVNSGSQQAEEQIVRQFQQKYQNIKYIKTERENIYKAWNRAIKLASGKYITNANTDDRHRPNALDVLANALERNPDKALAYARFTGVKEVDGNRVFYYESPAENYSRTNLFEGRCLIGCQPMWRKSVHEDCGYFDEGFISSGDTEFWFRIAQKYNFIFIDENLGEFLESPDSVCHQNGRAISCFESVLVRRCYRQAAENGLIIGKGGISNSDIPQIKDWYAINLWKRKFKEKFGLGLDDPIETISEFRNNDMQPLLSVVIVTCNRSEELSRNISGLSVQTQRNFEIIVVDNGLGALELCRNIPSMQICCVKLKENLGPAFGRNVALGFAKTQYVAFIDDDAVPASNWVENILTAFQNESTFGLRGKIRPLNTASNVPEWYDLGDQVLPSMCETAGNSAFRKDVLDELGGFDTNMLFFEGADIAYRIHKKFNDAIGGVQYSPDVQVFHNSIMSEDEIKLATQVLKNLYIRHADAEAFVDCIKATHLSNQDTLPFYRTLNVALMLTNEKPHLALKWAQRAYDMEPLSQKACFALGSLYMRQGFFEEAEPMLIKTLSLMSGDLSGFYSDESEIGKLNYGNTSAAYISAASKLSQCYAKLNKFGKVKTVYQHLLENPCLKLTDEQRMMFESMVAKLQKIAAVPITFQQPDIMTAQPDVPHFNTVAQKPEDEYLISAIISTYNAEHLLKGCLDDLLRQTISDKLEIIVVNSGSQQNEEAMVREYQQKHKNIVYIKTQQRESIYAAWNRAVKVARGEFITNANTDDRHRVDALEIMAAELMANSAVGLVYADQITTDTPNATFENHNRRGELRWDDYTYERLKLGCCTGSQPMWRKSVHAELGYFDESLTCGGDWDFWLRIASKYPLKHIPQFLGIYYQNDDGIEHGRKIHSLYERYVVGRRYGTPYIAVIPYVEGPDYPLVSVIMPAYNAQDYIAAAIESVLIQSYRNFELIIIDDGSIDRTHQIVDSFKDDKIRYLYKENGGASSARNLGIRESKGCFLIMLDADDMMLPEYIVSHMRYFQKHPDADLIYCDHCLIDAQDKPTRELKQFEYQDRRHLIRDMFRCGYPIIQPRGCLKRSVIEKIGNYDESLVVGEDYDLMRRFIMSDLRACHLPESLYLRRIQPSSLSQANDAKKANSHFTVIKRFVESFEYEELFPDVNWQQILPDRRQVYAQCLIGATYKAIAKNYVQAKVPLNAQIAFDLACKALKGSLQSDPDNGQAKVLLDQCENAMRELLVEDMAEASSKG